MDDEIRLFNRNGNNIYLQKIGNFEYLLCGDLDYMRIGYDNKDKEKITFIDPDGGPYMHIDDFELENGGILSEIREDECNRYTFIFKT